MNKVAIIPLRAGSKGIPGKNKKKLLGRPLFTWVLGEAIFSNLDIIYIFTDDISIIDYVNNEYAWTNKVKIIKRSDESATDNASTETAMIEFSNTINENYDVICLLQATSPLTHRSDINRCLDSVTCGNFDSALSIVKTKRFIWDENGNSINYDYANRPRRQDFSGLNIENGAVYVSTKEQFLKSKIRIGGKIALIEMPEDTLMEIDEPTDWVIIEKTLENRLKEYKKNIKKIKAIFLDVDGVFTNGNVTNTKDGEFSKEFSMRDGMGLEIVRDYGIKVFVMTSEDSEIVASRMKKLGITNVFLGVKDKFSRIEDVLLAESLNRNEIAYLGDDINDLTNICSVAWGCVPSDGIDIVKSKSDFTLNSNGGNKAIREFVNFIINFNSRF